MTTLAYLYLIGSSLFLQVTRATIKSQMGSKFGKIGLGTEEKKISIDLSWEKCCDHSSAFFFKLIFFILTGN